MWIGDGIGRWKKSSSWQNSCNSVCRRQQWQSFSLIWNRSYRKIKAGIRTELQRRHVGKDKEKEKKSLHTAFLQIRFNKNGYLTDQRRVPWIQHKSLQWHNYCWNISHYSNEHCQEYITWTCFLSHEPNVSKHSCFSSWVCPQFSFRRLLKQATHAGGFATKSTQRKIEIHTTERILGIWQEHFTSYQCLLTKNTNVRYTKWQ